MVGRIGGGLDHAVGGAGWADAATFAGVGDQEVVPAVGAKCTGKTESEDAAGEVTAEFPPGYRWRARPGAILMKS